MIRKAIILLIRGYQRFVSPALPRTCRYHPSCSAYAIDAVQQYGASRGVILAGWRLLRCNPFSLGGYDPVERQTLFARSAAPQGGERSPAPRDGGHVPNGSRAGRS